MSNNMNAASTTPKAVLLGRQHDITSFASDDPTRYAINGVHYHAEKKRLEATNGCMLIHLPVLESEEFPAVATALPAPPVDCIIPVVPFKRAMANIPKKGRLPILENAKLDANGKVTLTTCDLDNEQAITAKPVDATYPNIDQVEPTEASKFSIALSPEYLGLICDYAKKHAIAPSIRFDFIDELSAVRFTINLPDGTKAEGLLMPIRLS